MAKKIKNGVKKVKTVKVAKKPAKKAVKKPAKKVVARKVTKKVAKKAAKKVTGKATKRPAKKVPHSRPLKKNEVPTANDGDVPGAAHLDMVEPPLTRDDSLNVEVDQGPETYTGEMRSENEEEYSEAEIEEDEEDQDDFQGADFGEKDF